MQQHHTSGLSSGQLPSAGPTSDWSPLPCSWLSFSPGLFCLPTLVFPCGQFTYCVFNPPSTFKFFIGFWLDLSHRLVLNIFPGHLMFLMCHRQLLTKVWSLLMMVLVTLHVSDPYRRTAYTLVLNACLELRIRVLTSPALPSLLAKLPRFAIQSIWCSLLVVG